MNRSQFKEVGSNFHIQGQFSQSNNVQENMWHSAHPILNNDILIGQNRRGSDVRSLVQNLMRTKQVKPVQNPRSTFYTYSNNNNLWKPTLSGTQQKIFQQIINLICEINDIKQDITDQKNQVVSLQIKRDHLAKKSSRYRQKRMSGDQTYPDPQNYQSNKTKNTNQLQYQSIINKLKSHELRKPKNGDSQGPDSTNKKHTKQLQQILSIQKQKLADLQQQLLEKKHHLQIVNDNRLNEQESFNIDTQISKLNYDIDRLNQSLRNQSHDDRLFEQIRYLNDENESLRQKTVNLLANSQYSGNATVQQQIIRLEEVIRQQSNNKQLFFDDLKRFKAQFEEVRKQNERLKSRKSTSKWGQNYHESNYNVKQHNNRFQQYNNLVSQMQGVLK